MQINKPIRIDKAVTYGVAKYRITHADLTDDDTSQTITLSELAQGAAGSVVPANARVMFAWANVVVPFSGGTVSAVTVALGDAGDIDELITAVSVFTGASGILPKSGAYTLGTYETAYAPIATFTSVDGNLLALDAGVLELFVQYEAITADALTS